MTRAVRPAMAITSRSDLATCISPIPRPADVPTTPTVKADADAEASVAAVLEPQGGERHGHDLATCCAPHGGSVPADEDYKGKAERGGGEVPAQHPAPAHTLLTEGGSRSVAGRLPEVRGPATGSRESGPLITPPFVAGRLSIQRVVPTEFSIESPAGEAGRSACGWPSSPCSGWERGPRVRDRPRPRRCRR